MKFNEIKKVIEEFVAEPRIFSPDQCDQIMKCFKIISDDVHGMIDGENIEQNQNAFQEVLSTLLMVSASVLNAPIDKNFARFITAFSELVYNWNANIWKDEVLHQMSLYMSRMVEVRNAMMITTTIMKDIDERMRDLSSWSPPAYEVAKEYFELLLKENDEEGKE